MRAAQRSIAASCCSFRAPSSFTGEDVVELHCHGGRIVGDALLAAAYLLGARPAEAGEFTLRAFLNDKIDLLASRGDRRSRRERLRASGARGRALARRRVLGGRHESSARVDDACACASKRGSISPKRSCRSTRHPNARRSSTSSSRGSTRSATRARSGRALRDGLSVAIAGPPNAGKSSLLNRLAGYDAAIVTEIPGTTRDPLREQLALDGLPVTVVDTAGLRDTERSRRARRRAPRAARGRARRSAALGRRRSRAARGRTRGGARPRTPAAAR